jgi:Ca2+-binding RTX toxin-like protein
MPAVEGMETRVLLAADITLLDRTLTMTGTEGNDVMAVTRVGYDDVRVTVNALTRTFDMDDVDSYRMLGLGGDDQLTKTGAVKRAEGLGFSADAGTGNDTVRGTDMIIRNAETLKDESGRIVATKVAGTNDQVVYGTAGNDAITLTEQGGDGATLKVNTTYFAQLDHTEYGNWTVLAREGNDTVNVGLFFPQVTVYGEAGNDVFNVAEPCKVALEGDDGDDLLRAQGAGFDQVLHFYGGDGTNTIEMGAQTYLDLNAVYNNVQQFADIQNVTNAQGTVIGDALGNRITVRATDTAGAKVYAGDGDDTVIGGPGNDYIDGGPGIDNLTGGGGTNTLLNGENGKGPQFFIDANRKLNVYGTLGADTFSVVRVGIDDVRATVNGVARTFDMDDFDEIFMRGGPGNDTMTAGAGVTELHMLGGDGNDRLTGNDRANELVGDAGDDVLNGAAGDDTLAGGDGNDTLDGGTGVDLLTGDGGNDTLYARDATVDFAVHGGPGTDRARVDPNDPRDGVEELLA